MRKWPGGWVLGGFAILAVLGLTAAALYRSWTARNTMISGQGYEGVIFSGAHAAASLATMLSAAPTDFWTPNEVEIETLEAKLAATAQSESVPGLHTLSQYRRQYFGFNRSGRPTILVVGLCQANGVDWTHAFVSLAEGGCHFEATYDVVKEKVTSLWALEGPGLDQPPRQRTRQRRLPTAWRHPGLGWSEVV
jgi:hypothetical protein